MVASRKRPITAAGWAPTKPVTGLPWRKTATVGRLWMPYWAARCCSASTSILASSIFPSRLATSASMTGPSMRQGPHQAAQKSTTTGSSCERSITSRWKFLAVMSIDLRLLLLGGGAGDECVERRELCLQRAADLLAEREHSFVGDSVVDVGAVFAAGEHPRVDEHG